MGYRLTARGCHESPGPPMVLSMQAARGLPWACALGPPPWVLAPSQLNLKLFHMSESTLTSDGM